MIRVIYWAGLIQKTKLVNSYAAAMRLIDKCHSNACEPRYETVDGESLVDTGFCFVTIAEACKQSPVMYA